MAVSHQALRRTIPPRRNVLCQRWLAIKASTTAQIGQLDCVARQQYVLSIFKTSVVRSECKLPKSTSRRPSPSHAATELFLTDPMSELAATELFYTYGLMSLWKIPFLCMCSIALSS